MVLAVVDPAKESGLRRLLESMNEAPGRVNPDNSLIPFGDMDTLHFARLLILDDQTTGDVRFHGLKPRTYPLYLAFLGDIDGADDAFLHDLANRYADGLKAIFGCCKGFDSRMNLFTWMKQHRSPSIANYVNTRGRTVRQVKEEVELKDAVERYLVQHASSLPRMSVREIYSAVREYVEGETSAGRLTLSDESRTPVGWWIMNKVHLIGMPLLGLLVSPLLIFVAPFYLIILRYREKNDPEVCPTVDQSHADALSALEDHTVTNQFSAMGSLKPGVFRLITTIGVLSIVDYAARHVVRPGRLGRIRTIHFARWVFVAGTERMIFCSNYDGSVESYMDDFINKTGFGLNASFSNAIGYPRTNWLILDGCSDERKYKEYLRRHTLPTQVWYKAYPGQTAIDLDRNTRIRKGLESDSMSDEEVREWLALL